MTEDGEAGAVRPLMAALGFTVIVSVGTLLLLLTLPFALATLVLGTLCYGAFLGAARFLEMIESGGLGR